MMRVNHTVLAIFISLLSLSLTAEDTPRIIEYDFRTSPNGFSHGFADYTPHNMDSYQMNFAHHALPSEIGPGRGLLIEGHNHSDDLFMYIKREISGLEPAQHYTAKVVVEFASRYPEESMGIGGAPGASVYLKSGLVPDEPLSNIEDLSTGELIMRMNIDIGSQSIAGAHAQLLGNIAIEGHDDSQYRMLTRTNEAQELSFTSTPNGTAWFFVGTDSGYEGITSIYYTRVVLEIAKR